MIVYSLIALSVMGWAGVIGTNLQACRALGDEEEFHRVGLRCGIYSIGTALALGFLGLIA